MVLPNARRTRFVSSSRSFFVSTALITLIAACSFLAHSRHGADDAAVALQLLSRSDNPACELVHQAKDKCAFVQVNCREEEGSLLPYLTFYYCTLGHVHPVGGIILVTWLGLLFSTIGVAASDFFSVNLGTLASILSLSESLAGVTLLAFGNGSPDLFSTLAAMGSNSGSLALGELIGAASFITTVVAGFMAIMYRGSSVTVERNGRQKVVKGFRVSRKSFVRDICFFIVAVAFAVVFLADGKLKLWESLVMVGFYGFYVLTVVGWHWVSTRRKKRRAREVASRAEFYVPTPAASAEELEPYSDDAGEGEDAETAPLHRRREPPSPTDLSLLERGPRIQISGVEGAADEEALGEEDEEEVGRRITAEMTSSMRVNRPRGRRSNSSVAPIRPSLVGVLEFRSVLSSLQKSGNVHLSPIDGRKYAHGYAGGQSDGAAPYDTAPARPRAATTGPDQDNPRDRPLSYGDLPLHLQDTQLPSPAIASRTSSEDLSNHAPGSGETAAATSTAPAGAAVPSGVVGLASTTGQKEQQASDASSQHERPPSLQLQIPGASQRRSPVLASGTSPFPGYTESPMPTTPSMPSRAPSFVLPTAELEHSDIEAQPAYKPVRWWPYALLPPPHEILCALFPTLQSWGNKSIWDRFISVITVPSIFLLVITLPVVEADPLEDDSVDTPIDPPNPGEPGNVAVPVSVEPDVEPEPESEWRLYQQSVMSGHSRNSYEGSLLSGAQDAPRRSSGAAAAPQASSLARVTSATTISVEEPAGWNRWLLILQIFVGPLFTVFIVWANMAEDLERPGKMLVRLVLYSLLTSLIVLGLLLLTTSPDKRPKYHYLLCFPGFVIGVAWISTVAGEVVGVLKAFGIILGMSEAILGLTIFAVGNSLSDLIADATVARLGYPVMALSACFGGPMLNILLGVGIGGAWMSIDKANKSHKAHPDKPIKYKPYHIEVGGTLMISAISVLATLLFLLVIVPANGWVMSRKIGLSLIAIWVITTIVNVVAEVTGVFHGIA